jgi:8-oxo-dGTP pyrophosphatase MutT (NUDIX family)
MSEPSIHRWQARLVYANDYARVYDDDVVFGDGRPGRHLRVHPAGPGPGVVILPVHDGAVALVRTYRYPIAAWQWALPRGFSHGADPLETAKIELVEELGVSATRLRLLGQVTPDSGLLDSRVAVVLAHAAETALAPRDHLEVAAARWAPLAEITALIARGELDDGLTLAALALAHSQGALR